MNKIMGILILPLLVLGCGEAPKDNKVRQAVEEVVTQDFKAYEGAKQSLDGIDQSSRMRQKEMSEMLNQ